LWTRSTAAKDERAHEEGDRRSRYRSSHRLAQLAFDGELYRHLDPHQDGEQQKQGLHTSSPFPITVYHASLS
jgi:hypothetical protein